MPEETAIETIDAWCRSPTAVERTLGLWPGRAGVSRTKPGYAKERRAVSYHSLHLVLDGELRVRHGDGPDRLLDAGSVFCLFPEQPCDYRPSDEHGTCWMTWIAPFGRAAGSVVAELGLTPAQPCRRVASIDPFVRRLPRLAESFDPDGTGGPLAALTYLLEFCEASLPGREDHSPRGQRREWIGRGRAFIDAHFDQITSVGEVARYVNIDRSHFVKEFARAVGITPGAYLRDRRMARARQLLSDTDLSVTEIARSVGYADLYSFSRSFRRHVGVPPTACRTSNDQHDTTQHPTNG